MSKQDEKNQGPKQRGRKTEKEKGGQAALNINSEPPVECYRECEIEHTNKFPFCQQGCPIPECNGVDVPEATAGADPDAVAIDPKGNTTVIKPLTVEVFFPIITDLKQTVSFEKGSVILGIKFNVKLDNKFDLFRLANLISQQGSGIFCTLGSNQVALDFAFNPDDNSFEVIRPEQVPVPSQEEGEDGQDAAD